MSRLEGRFTGLVKSIQYSTAKTGTDQLAVELEVVGDSPQKGQRCTSFLAFSDATASYSIAKLKATGWPGGDLASLSDPETDLPAYTPVECDFDVRYEMHEGKDRMKVEIAFGGGKINLKNPMDSNARRVFGAKYNALVDAPVTNTGTEFPPKGKPAGKAAVKL
jgi:hypothetical protein